MHLTKYELGVKKNVAELMIPFLDHKGDGKIVLSSITIDVFPKAKHVSREVSP